MYTVRFQLELSKSEKRFLSVTYDNHPFIEELYGDGVAKVKKVSRRYSIAKAAE